MKNHRFINFALNQADSINCPFSSSFAKVSRFSKVFKCRRIGIGVGIDSKLAVTLIYLAILVKISCCNLLLCVQKVPNL